MTTQATVKITNADAHSIYLDRYADGFLAVTGADVLKAAQLAYSSLSPHCPHNPPDVIAINYLLSQLAPPTPFQGATPLYRLIAAPDLDTEHFYHIDCTDRFTFINYAAGFIATDIEDRLYPYTLEQFRDLINEQRDTCNEALAKIAAIDPYYAALDPFPQLQP